MICDYAMDEDVMFNLKYNDKTAELVNLKINAIMQNHRSSITPPIPYDTQSSTFQDDNDIYHQGISNLASTPPLSKLLCQQKKQRR